MRISPLSLFLVVSCAGCSTTLLDKGTPSTLEIDLLATAAWHRHKADCTHTHIVAFGDGFIAGYREICAGGDGLAPAVPPKHYRGVSDADKAKGHAWFEGFAQGVIAAQKEGREDFRKLVISPDAGAGAARANSSFRGFAPTAHSTVETPSEKVKPIESSPQAPTKLPSQSSRTTASPRAATDPIELVDYVPDEDESRSRSVPKAVK